MSESERPNHFLENLVAADLNEGRITDVVTRFPPEPNGFLHIGHAKSICLNFGLAERFGGRCHLRFDDTNPEKESDEYIQAIQEDIRWLGFQWSGDVRFASSYFDTLYDWACVLIKEGLAYVCDLSADEARAYRGTLTEPGQNSPYRDRDVDTNLRLFSEMKEGLFDDGSRVLRAKIDMASPNMNLRDPILYRIRRVTHHQTGDAWLIYPTYDFAHGQGDAIEGVTHSLCSLEFEDHRPLYDWFIRHLPTGHVPHQYEFGRLNLNFTVTSKRKLKLLVDEGIVTGWDDPRMPTIAGMRRRGYSAQAIRTFCDRIGVTRSDGVVDVAMLEHAVRDDLNTRAPRAMAVLNPLTVTLTNLDADHHEIISAANHPQDDSLGTRDLIFTQQIVIDADDFLEAANKKFKRLVLGKRVRLRNAYVIEAHDVIKNDTGQVIEVLATIVENTIGADPDDGVKPKGVIQWVSKTAGQRAKVRLYDRLFTQAEPEADGDFLAVVNPNSLIEVTSAYIEPSLVSAEPEAVFQFEREGYFVADRFDHSQLNPVFNRTIGLRDTWQDGAE